MIKRCPICGSKARVYRQYYGQGDFMVVYVACTKCDTRTEGSTDFTAKTNRRLKRAEKRDWNNRGYV